MKKLIIGGLAALAAVISVGMPVASADPGYGYYRQESTTGYERYGVFDHNVVPGEPGWLPSGTLVIPMRKRLAFAGSFVVAFLATASVVLSSVAITLAEALEEKP